MTPVLSRKWIHQEAKTHSADVAFRKLQEAHSKFHRSAADVVRRLNLGEKVAQETLVGRKSAFGEAANQVIALLGKVQLREKARYESSILTRTLPNWALRSRCWCAAASS